MQGCYSQLATYELMLVIRCKATFNNIHYCCNNEAARSAHNAVDYIYRQIHTGQITNNDLRPPEHTQHINLCLHSSSVCRQCLWSQGLRHFINWIIIIKIFV